MLCGSGQQFKDWSWAYRLFRVNRMNINEVFSVVRREAVELLPCTEGATIYAHMDDTLLRKRGKKVAGGQMA